MSPPKLEEMPAVPVLWFTLAMVQLAAPLALDTAVQLCCEPPVPSVKVTVRPETSVPEEGSFVVKVPDSVAGCPLVTVVGPVYVSVVEAGVTVKVLDELFVSNCGIEDESPGNVAAIGYVPTGSFGVRGQDATPFAPVAAVQVWVPSVNVTGSFGTGWLVKVLISGPETGVDPL